MTDASLRITRVRFAGLRTATDVTLDLDGLTVLIGPNGVGKSTLIEGLELLRLVTAGDDFLRTVYEDHGGPAALVSHEQSELKLGLDLVGDDGSWSYGIVLQRSNGTLRFAHESLHHDGEVVFIRRDDDIVVKVPGFTANGSSFPSRSSLLFDVSRASMAVARVRSALAQMEIHPPFATQSAWQGRNAGYERGMRGDNIIQATARLSRGGGNLPNAIHELRNRDDWQDTLATIQVVVDDDIRDVVTPASASGGNIGLAVVYRTGTVPSFALSDGTLALLALVAMSRLGREPSRSLLVLDEPDLHLHPTVMPHVVSLLEEIAERCPVVISTHSDHLLDCLSEPARSTVLCDLDAKRHLRLRRPDGPQLDKWLREYRGVGRIRAEGYEAFVFPSPAVDES